LAKSKDLELTAEFENISLTENVEIEDFERGVEIYSPIIKADD
jgi:hypothetical protein